MRWREGPIRATAATVLLLGAAAVHSVAQANVVPTSRLGTSTIPITANALKPAACAALNLTGLVTGSGTITGGGQNELILGSAAADSIDARPGNDCVVAGGGADLLTGGSGTDVCVGGPDTDIFVTGCETQIQ